jgi:hypothetical protein
MPVVAVVVLMQFVWATISVCTLACLVAKTVPNVKVQCCPAIAQMVTTSNPERKMPLGESLVARML